MEFASEVGDVASGLTQDASAMQTYVVECLDLGRAGTHHDQRFVRYLIDHVVPDVGNFLNPARHLPGSAPHSVGLEAIKLWREVTLPIDLPPIRLGDVVVALLAQRRWHRPPFPIQEFFYRRSRAQCASG